MIDVIMFPYAGSIGYAYQKILSYFNRKRYRIHMMDLNGRGERMEYPKYHSWNQMVEDMFHRTQKIISNAGNKYVLFGHSMGSKIAYDVYLKIVANEMIPPQCIFFSGCQIPSLENNYGELYSLPEDEFEKEYIELGGVPKEVLQNQDFKEIIFESIKEDVKLLTQYRPKRNKIKDKVVVLNGDEDEISEKSDWKEQCEDLVYRMYNGNHFFIFQSGREVVSEICGLIDGQAKKYASI
ncbi:thioesterase II family protein [Anaerosporobacter sp.]|uniref:thioesterase II family protein n=1 Tax=Anaerosporobacter sp. TaxID=1872529 RepID=UPI00286F85F8|nr:thioesterase domain-containing protein [Anaerosporobacter sp.]